MQISKLSRRNFSWAFVQLYICKHCQLPHWRASILTKKWISTIKNNKKCSHKSCQISHSQQFMFCLGGNPVIKKQQTINHSEADSAMCDMFEKKCFKMKSGSFNSVEDLQRSPHMIHRPYHPPVQHVICCICFLIV